MAEAEIQTPQIVAILDAGSQFGKVIDRRIRELLVESELLDFNTPAEQLKKYTAIVISGGPDSVYADTAPKYDPEIWNLGIPILGICYGMQLMVHLAGGSIERKETREDGQFEITCEGKSLLFSELDNSQQVLLTHGDSVVDPGRGIRVTARSSSGIIAAVENASLKQYGVQFHPEVDLTVNGKQMLSNFLFKIAGCEPSFTIEDRESKAISEIQETVGSKKVLCLVSGGVDSSVCAALLRKALPAEQILAVHIDHGFMRHEESSSVYKALSNVGLDCEVLSVAKEFANSTTDISGTKTPQLQNAIRPEVKRKIIGDTFMRVSEDYCKKNGLTLQNVFLAQGTLRPDLIESASNVANKGKTADVIKTHHNDTQLVRALRDQGCVIEPLKDYHKDEVRALGRGLNLPQHLVMRQPFPGPGLAIRILCCDAPFLTESDDDSLAYLRELERKHPKFAFALLAFRTVGVQGDGRSYKNCVSFSFKEKTPIEKADWEEIFSLAKEIPRELHSVNRLIFAFGSPVSGHQKEITPTTLKPDVIQLCRDADKVVNDVLYKHGLNLKLSQVPVVLFPSSFGIEGARSICVRTFITNDFMTGVPAVIGKDFPFEALNEILNGVSKIKGIARICYDLTAKPPGTTEWE